MSFIYTEISHHDFTLLKCYYMCRIRRLIGTLLLSRRGWTELSTEVLHKLDWLYEVWMKCVSCVFSQFLPSCLFPLFLMSLFVLWIPTTDLYAYLIDFLSPCNLPVSFEVVKQYISIYGEIWWIGLFSEAHKTWFHLFDSHSVHDICV